VVSCTLKLKLFRYLTHTNDYRVDLAAKSLTDQLRMIYTVRETVSSIAFPSSQGLANMTDMVFKKKHEDVLVRFGELKSARGKDTGRLVVGLSSDVIGIRNGRSYVINLLVWNIKRSIAICAT
jgi:hypothetical protein